MSTNNEFVTVPDTTLPGGRFVPSFQVFKYLASRGEDGKPQGTMDGKPWVRISYHDTRKVCAEAGLQLITESQWLALAYQVAADPRNWTCGKVGEGKLFQGLRKGTVREAQAGTYEPQDADERRCFYLPNDEVVLDVAGNAYQWVFDDVQGDDRGLVARPFVADSPSRVIPFPGEEKGQGWTPAAGRDWSGNALIRGGCWVSDSFAGVFNLGSVWPVGGVDLVGFRCTKPLGL